MKTTDTRPDTLTQEIGVLVRREVEARILAPVIDALGEKFGREAVIEVVRDAIVEPVSYTHLTLPTIYSV